MACHVTWVACMVTVQSLCFLVRDWYHSLDHAHGLVGGDSYLQKVLRVSPFNQFWGIYTVNSVCLMIAHLSICIDHCMLYISSLSASKPANKERIHHGLQVHL